MQDRDSRVHQKQRGDLHSDSVLYSALAFWSSLTFDNYRHGCTIYSDSDVGTVSLTVGLEEHDTRSGQVVPVRALAFN